MTTAGRPRGRWMGWLVLALLLLNLAFAIVAERRAADIQRRVLEIQRAVQQLPARPEPGSAPAGSAAQSGLRSPR